MEINIHATNQDLVFEEFKDGFVGIRTHPDLRLNPNPKHGVKEVFGKARNSEGIEGKSIWENGRTGFIIMEKLKVKTLESPFLAILQI